ncbi:hypothetical protein NJB1604_25200 [Mycobacterium marinum]|nr:hypothetical protein NJB1604_25200 [Mycobacterium marinum]
MFVFGHRRGAVLACRRESTVPYALRGLLFCAACGRRMQGAAPVGKRTTRILYGCELGTSRSVPADLSDHPRTGYLREDEVTARLYEWIATLADPEDLACGQDADPEAGTGYAALLRQLASSEPKDRAPCLPRRSANWSRNWVGCQPCSVPRPGRDAHRCRQA